MDVIIIITEPSKLINYRLVPDSETLTIIPGEGKGIARGSGEHEKLKCWACFYEI